MQTREANNKAIILGAAVLLLTGLVWGGSIFIQTHQNWEHAVDDLETIYAALERYEDKNGSLPVLSLYPSDPLMGDDSIRFVLARYLVDLNVFVSPVGHRDIQRTGLTYIWNPNLNRQRLGAIDPPQWILTDIQALDAGVKKAHRFGYAALFSDGTVKKLKTSPFRMQDVN